MPYLDAGIKRSHRLLPWQRQAIADAYGAGEKVEAVAAEFQITSARVSQIGIGAGHPRRRPTKIKGLLKPVVQASTVG